MTAISRALRGFGAFWWDFIVGDDWRMAAGVVAALAVTAGLVAVAIPAWWLLPATVFALLALSLRRAVRADGAAQADGAVRRQPDDPSRGDAAGE